MAWKQPTLEEEEAKTSKINSAGLINSTLERLWLDVYNAMDSGDYVRWNIKLDAIWSILGGDCKDGDADDKGMKDINLKIYETGSLNSKIGSGFSQSTNPNNSQQYQLLLKKNLFLRRLQNSQGKGTAYASDDDFDFD